MLFAVNRVHADAVDLLQPPWLASSVLLASALTAASSSARATSPEIAVPNRFLILDLLALPPHCPGLPPWNAAASTPRPALVSPGSVRLLLLDRVPKALGV